MTNNNSQNGSTSLTTSGFAMPITIAIIVVAIVVAGVAYYAIRQPAQAGSRVNFQATNLDPLEKGHYEGWVVVGDKKISFGNFNVNEQKQLLDLSGRVITEFRTKEKVATVDVFAISIEPDNDNDPGPSPSLILFGKAVGNRANLSFGIGLNQIDFNKLSGRYILKTPTDDEPVMEKKEGEAMTGKKEEGAMMKKDETAGVWFVDPTNAPKLAASLNLPDVPLGWKYEGWAVPAGNPSLALSTGRFTKVNGSDEFSGYSSKKSPAPPFPGEDFLQNLPFGLKAPLALDDGKSLVVVSIEPDLNGIDPTGDKPSQLKPLIGKIPAGAKDTFLYNLELKKDSLPTGVASLLP